MLRPNYKYISSIPSQTSHKSSFFNNISRRHLSTTTQTKIKASTNGDIEVGVFRFTLGIPGFDDNLIPRFVGIIAGIALIANHLASDVIFSEAQHRTELVGAMLSVLCIATPTIGARLEELKPGKGRKASAGEIEGGRNVFALSSSLTSVSSNNNNNNTDDSIKQTLAWSTYALLLNTNICGLLIVRGDQVVACRGVLGNALSYSGNNDNTKTTTAENIVNAASQAWQKLPISSFNKTATEESNAVYLQDRAAIDRIGLGSAAFVPEGVKSALLQPIVPISNNDAGGSNNGLNSNKGYLVLLSERERALSKQERAWAAAIADKLFSVL